jgi:serine protease Do
MKLIRTWLPVLVIAGLVAYIAVDGRRLATSISYAVTKGRNDADREKLAGFAKADVMSPLFVQVAKVVKPAVVEVRVTTKVKMNAPPGMEEYFRRYFGGDGNGMGEQGGPAPHGRQGRTPPREFLQRGLGSGVVVDGNNGYVLTNYHVVVGADQTQVVLHDGTTLNVEWIRSDPMTDLAVLKVKGGGLVDAPMGDSEAMQVGDMVLAIGSPEGLPQTVTAGIISARGRTTQRGNAYESFLQTDASINHGNSGGPLVNMKGEIIGINSAIISESGGNEGIGFAIPSNMVKTVMAQLIEKGKVTRGYLGVSIQGVDEKLAKSFGLPNTKGVLISGIAPGGPAEKAGIKAGDFIVTIAGKAVENANELRNLVADQAVGKSVAAELYREGKKQTLNVTIDAQPANMLAALGGAPGTQPAEAAAGKFGLEVAKPTETLARQFGYKAIPKGVIVTQVVDGSSADDQGLKAGMTITQIQSKPVTSVEEFQKAVIAKDAADGVRVRVTDPSGASRFVFLSPGK